ncbi:hypothetical protein SIAM614_06343 [Stappia aggregata IAM 12614]|uniref:AB hydrolase-1 domain-containing protein n=1 Tax=Roseibium aggregatum (strain ATCC 25650 / DSM 13394 / JCM 20685 / NBRC 16684 / NCIMB 2208 / IAM 12614 / B1) TaxID=384765 RepID=A0NVB4_ROSAI|nr:hypothetical protein SIAM614_06343 [Stappia aggregata IAM 12614] [Roseibium aggregatum IAM 12614]
MRGHRVTTPTQTGLGERSHLLSPDITIQTFVEDIVRHLQFEDLTDVILVGHSFGGIPITGVADILPERIAKLVSRRHHAGKRGDLVRSSAARSCGRPPETG